MSIRVVILVMLCVVSQYVVGQENKFYQLDSIVVKAERIKYRYSNFSRNKVMPFHFDSTGINSRFSNHIYIVTKLYNNFSQSIIIENIQAKLAIFDSTMLDVKLVFFQRNNIRDSIIVLQIKPQDISNNTLTLNLLNENIKFMSGEYFIGFGFYNKSKTKWKYKMFLHPKEEAFILSTDKQVVGIDSAEMGAFQFSMQYYRVSE